MTKRMNKSYWPDNSPDSLSDICLEYCVKNLDKTICEYKKNEGAYQMKRGLFLPQVLNEQLFYTCIKAGVLVDRNTLGIFQEPNQSKLLRLNLKTVVDLTDEDLENMLKFHCPVELYAASLKLTQKSLQAINRFGNRLVGLHLLNATGVLLRIDANPLERLECQNLLFLCLNQLGAESTELLNASLAEMRLLKMLDLSYSDIDMSQMKCFNFLQNLEILKLHNVVFSDLTSAFQVITQAKSLRVLDIGQSRHEEPVLYKGDVEKNMKHLVQSLKQLTHLDIAGTNLAGRKEDPPVSHRPEKCGNCMENDRTNKNQHPIPGLEGRQLEYLGLLNCAHSACERENLPARRVTGDVDENQILLSVQSYIERQELLLMSLNNLFHLFKFSECTNHRRALEGILDAMKAYREEKTIQISGSATLFYIVKGDCKHFFTTKIKKELVKVLLDAMETHVSETTMLRNGCLTLCHFKIPQDVMHSYERLVSLLLRIVHHPGQLQEAFVQRIGIYLLNSLACQVDHAEKELVGNLGAFKTMLSLIKEKLDHSLCDEVMEVAWSMMWNVTDETAINCERFIIEGGMTVFMKCLEKFPEEEELLRNMMGLMGNVAEVHYLRPQLLTSVYVPIFSNLLDSSSDGIEVSYNACGVLAHLMSDGPEVWSIHAPSRNSVLEKMVRAISRWKLDTKRNINYRSFQPILRLLPNFTTPQVQHWAVWALCNLTKMYKSKYCPLLESEDGLPLLEMICNDPRPYAEIRFLSKQVINRCRHFREHPDSTSEDEQDAVVPVPMAID